MGVDAEAKVRVLVVDDSRLMQKAAHKMLGAEFDVITADDGVDAWNQLQKDPTIQVVFTDLSMPKMDGYELLQTVRGSSEPGLLNLPMIVVTGADNDESARLRALELGATDFITKPFTTVDLLARARAHANHQRITRELQAQSTRDPLTGLANKAGFLERLQQDLAYARRHQQDLTLVRLEIDDFRSVFLRHGKGVAEALMVSVAQAIRSRIRREDTAGRIGLGGFALSLPAGKADGIAGMVDRLRLEVAALPAPAGVPPMSISLSASVSNPDVMAGPGAQAALDECQSYLSGPGTVTVAPLRPSPVAVAPVATTGAAAGGAVPATEALSVAAAAAPESSPVPAPDPRAVPATPPVVPSPILIDPFLDEIKLGQTRPAVEKMPLLLNRLLPLLRLLTPNQREHLIRFLQQMGAAR